MIEIVRPGRKKIVTCETCEAVIRYEDADVIINKTFNNEILYTLNMDGYIVCPCCGEEIKVIEELRKCPPEEWG